MGGWIASGAIGCVAAGPWLPSPAVGQTLRPAMTTDGPFLPLRPRTQRRAEPSAQSETSSATPAPVLRPSADDNQGVPAVGDELSAEPPVNAPTGLRPATLDGEAAATSEPPAPIDGVMDEPEIYENPDGADPVSWDARSADDAGAFEKPPAGFDPDLFRAEIAPILDRRPERLFRFEPWQPRGIRVGSFVALPSIDIGGAFVSNVFKATLARPDRDRSTKPRLINEGDD